MVSFILWTHRNIVRWVNRLIVEFTLQIVEIEKLSKPSPFVDK